MTWSEFMAPNSKIYSFKIIGSLHLKLTDDFEGSSAYEIINTLTDYGKGFYEIFLNTKGLKSSYPYSKDNKVFFSQI